MFKKSISYKDVLFFLTITLLFSMLCAGKTSFSPFGLSFYVSLLYLNFNPFAVSVAYILGYIFDFNLLVFYSALISVGVLLPIFLTYQKNKKNVGAEVVFYTILSCIGFILIVNEPSILYRIIKCSVSLILTFVFINASRTIFVKKFDYKITGDEGICLAVFVVLSQLGFINLFSVSALKMINVFLILSFAYIFPDIKAISLSVILSLAPTLFNQNLSFAFVYATLCFSSLIFINYSRIVSALALLLADLPFMFFTSIYGGFTYVDLLFLIAPVTVFIFMPTSVLSHFKNKVNALNSKVLSKYAVNKMRATISSRLYIISEVFSEMELSFAKLKDLTSSSDDLLNKMADEVLLNVCEKCPSFIRCKQKGEPNRAELIKILTVGVAKNRVSLVDLTKQFTENCGYVNGVIFEINSLISKYREKVKESEDVLSGKELIKMQSQGVAGVLKSMAFDFSKTLPFSSKAEKRFATSLKNNGVIFNELMIVEQDGEIEINIAIKNEYVTNGRLISAVNKITGYDNCIVLKTPISATACAVTIKKSPCIDAAFGLAVKQKVGSCKSGDTHALTKIDEGKFLIALSDGMGSGLKAENTSSTAISLIESFYKAGLESSLILNMVNKVLALNTDDNFSAMDILTVDLFSLSADFIKIGAPYSFILSDDSIKIVEGSSLPLGILDDLSPTGCSCKLTEGNTIIMITDGVSDAFSSTTDLIDFLRTLDNKNPQHIADCILNKALNVESGVPKDDMTVLAVRIFRKYA